MRGREYIGGVGWYLNVISKLDTPWMRSACGWNVLKYIWTDHVQRRLLADGHAASNTASLLSAWMGKKQSRDATVQRAGKWACMP